MQLSLLVKIDTLKEAVQSLLKNELTKKTTLEFIEPDFNFILMPMDDIFDIGMDWKVFFNNEGALTENFLSVALVREDIQYLKTYLQFITGEISCDDPKCIELIKRGIIHN